MVNVVTNVKLSVTGIPVNRHNVTIVIFAVTLTDVPISVTTIPVNHQVVEIVTFAKESEYQNERNDTNKFTRIDAMSTNSLHVCIVSVIYVCINNNYR